MNALPATALIGALVDDLDDRLLRTGTDRAFVTQLCAEAIAFAWTISRDLPNGHVGRRARTAAALLLELGAPEVSSALRGQLSVACEIIAIGAHGNDD
ncbi:MAG: hypothetical protein JWP74_2652 [Marmoricola sp.]|nr:hypothetical protein [Marmoricola sp.]